MTGLLVVAVAVQYNESRSDPMDGAVRCGMRVSALWSCEGALPRFGRAVGLVALVWGLFSARRPMAGRIRRDVPVLGDEVAGR